MTSTIHPDDYAAHIATEADANRERFAGSYAELPTWSPEDEMTDEDVAEYRTRKAQNILGKLILRSRGANEDFNLGDALND